MQDPVDDGNGRRHGALFTDDRLDAAGHVEIAGIGHAMRDDRRFQGHDRRTALLGSRDFV